MRVEGFHTTDDGVPIWWGMTGPETGPLLVLCDGIGCDGFIWAHLIDHFCPDVRILRWHYRGHGRSGAPDDRDGLRLERLAADLNEIHRALDLPPGIIAGHSMGVQLSLEYYRQSPDQCTALVLLCGSYGRPMSTFQGTDLGETILPLLQSAVDWSPGTAKLLWSSILPTELSYRLAQATEINGQRVRRADFMPYLEHASRLDPRIFLSMLAHAAEHDCEDMLETIEVPTLIVAGGLDGFTPGDLSRHMQEAIPRGELYNIPEGTHTAPIEFPEALNAQLRQFFTKHQLA